MSKKEEKTTDIQKAINAEEERKKKIEEVKNKILAILEENNMDLQVAVQHVPVVNLTIKERK
jgi:predicted nucleotide-binding protein (sugar kinase/HSP70/actin superfamily)